MIGIGDGERTRIFPGGVFEVVTDHDALTDALDSIPVPPGAIYAEITVDSGGNGMLYWGGSNAENTAYNLSGYTEAGLPIAAGATSHLIPCAMVNFLVVEGVGGTVSCLVRWVMASDPR